MRTDTILILCIFVGFAVMEALRGGFFKKKEQRPKDGIVEFISTAVLLVITQPLILFASFGVMAWAFPQAENSLATLPVIAQIGLLLVGDDMMQYWWHRLSHSTPWLYSLHRPHHDAQYMSVRIVYRNNIFYYAMMPGIWISGILIYLGLGYVYAGYIVVKLLVITGAHSSFRWDEKLYQIAWMSPIMWVVERTISTPATHAAHHGRHASDPATNYKGNYGNLLFFWDVLFGTAKITRRYPELIGVENLPEVGVGEQLLWPVIRASKQAGQPTATPAE